jgi:L-galactose dehydrogenase/L-glyceraldehyde 3-phosphate reductase
MKTKQFGRTDLDVSIFTFGCGAVGGLMTKGNQQDQDRAVAWARDNGINHFDTAPSYGDTTSETNLGRALGSYRNDIVISTKLGFSQSDLKDIDSVTQSSLNKSLKRLRQDHVDIFQLHNTIDNTGAPGTIKLDQVINDVLPAFVKAREQGKVRYLGFTAKGETADLHEVVNTDEFASSQVFYNLLAPSAGEPIHKNFPCQDFQELLTTCQNHGVGTIGVRILAGGALSGNKKRHPLGMQDVAPIGSGKDYLSDVKRALMFQPLLDDEYVTSLTELAIRYAISQDTISTIEVGIATIDELQGAVEATNKGALATDTLYNIKTIQNNLSVEE